MTETLATICAAKREHVTARKAAVPEAQLLEKANAALPPRGFRKALKAKLIAGQFALIAEIKKASPSAGLIRTDFDVPVLAAAYLEGGATCLSVLTDEPYFQGHDSFLSQARDAVPLPALRKDFMLDPYQIIESRALGADCVLLIIAALSDVQANELFAAATGLGMDALVEVHDEKELERALRLQPELLGINNRNLKTMAVDLATSETLAKALPPNILVVSESGLRTHEDLQRMEKSGISAFLVGESLMRAPNITKATRLLLGD